MSLTLTFDDAAPPSDALPIRRRELPRGGYELQVGAAVVVRVGPGSEGGYAVTHVPAQSRRTYADAHQADAVAARIARLHAA